MATDEERRRAEVDHIMATREERISRLELLEDPTDISIGRYPNNHTVYLPDKDRQVTVMGLDTLDQVRELLAACGYSGKPYVVRSSFHRGFATIGEAITMSRGVVPETEKTEAEALSARNVKITARKAHTCTDCGGPMLGDNKRKMAHQAKRCKPCNKAFRAKNFRERYKPTEDGTKKYVGVKRGKVSIHGGQAEQGA